MIRRIGFERNLLQETFDCLCSECPDARDFRSCTVVFPSRRMRTFLLNLMQKRLGKPFFPPKIITIDRFFETLFMAAHPGFSRLDDLQGIYYLFLALQNTFGKEWYGDSKKEDSFLDRFGWLEKIFEAVEELLTEGGELNKVNPEIFSRFVQLGDYHGEYKRFISGLPELVSRYRTIMTRNQVASRGMIYAVVAERIQKKAMTESGNSGKIFLVGFNGLNGSEKKLFRHLLLDRNAWLLVRGAKTGSVLAGYPFNLQSETVTQLGDKFDDRSGSDCTVFSQLAEKSIAVHQEPDRETMMAVLCDVLNREICGTKKNDCLQKIGIVLPDSTALIPFIQGVVSRIGVSESNLPFNISLSYPFGRTPLYQLFDLMLNILESGKNHKISTKNYLALLRHPYVKIAADPREAEMIRRLVHLAESEIGRRNLQTIDPKVFIESLMQFLPEDSREAGCEIVTALHQRLLLETGSQLPQISAALRGISEYIVQNSSFLFIREYVNSAFCALDSLDQFLAQYPVSRDANKTSSRTKFVRDFLNRVKISFRGSPLKGIQVMGMLEYRGLSFEKVFILDAVEGVLPRQKRYDPLLPRDIRRLFGIRENSDWEKLYAFDFFSLISGADRVEIFWSGNSADLPARPSRFIEQLALGVELESGKNVKRTSARLPVRVENHQLRRIRKNSSIMSVLEKMEFSPSALETYLVCPLKFYFRWILRLEPRDLLKSEPDASELGTIIHESLCQLYSRKIWLEPACEIRKILGSELKAQFTRFGFDPDAGTHRIRLWTMEEKLSDFIMQDIADMNIRKRKIVGLEQKMFMQKHVNAISTEVTLKGRIDRLEREGDVYAVMDYKTGTSFTAHFSSPDDLKDHDLTKLAAMPDEEYRAALEKTAALYKNFQMLVYVMLTQKNHSTSHTPRAAYVFLKNQGNYQAPVFLFSKMGKKRKVEMDDDMRRQVLSIFETHLENIFTDMFKRPEFLANPGKNSGCEFCPFRVPCGNVK